MPFAKTHSVKKSISILAMVTSLFFIGSSITPAQASTTYTITFNDNSATSGSAPANQTKTQGVDLTLATNSGNLVKTGFVFAGWNTSPDGTGTRFAAGGTYSVDAADELFAYWVIDLSASDLDFNKRWTGSATVTQVDENGSSSLDFGTNMQTNGTVNYLDVGPQGLDARVTLKTVTGASNVELDDATSGSGENRYIRTDIDFSASNNDRWVEFELEFFRNLDTTPVPQSVSGLRVSLYDLDLSQLFRITTTSASQAPSYTLAQETIIAASNPANTNTLQFYTSNLRTDSAPTGNTAPQNGPNFRSSFSQGRVSFTFPTAHINAVSELEFAFGLSADDPGSSGASYALDFGQGRTWGARTMDTEVTLNFNQAPSPQDTVIFEANGGSGTMANQRAAATTALTSNAFTRTGFTFSGWATSSNGQVVYADGANFTFTAGTAITPLYAIWTPVQQQSSSATVTFDANGGSGTMETQTASSATSLRANAFARPGHVFNGWNTQANGSGTAYADGASFPFSANTTLYAQWILPAPYSGPIPIQIIEKTIPEQTESLVTLAGERLNQITAATVLGKTVQVTPVDASNIRLLFPALPVGVYDVTYTYRGGGILTHQRGLTVVPGKVVKDPEVFTISKRFTNYRGDRGPVVARDQRAIAAFIKENPGLTSINCEGSTSGVPAIRTDAALATARAQNACRIVARLVPGIKTTISISTGQGIGQYYRAVTLSGEGVRQN